MALGFQNAPSGTMRPGEQIGLSQRPRHEWPSRIRPPGVSASDWLAPGTRQHQIVLDYLLQRIDTSERYMRRFYHRWRAMEMKYQAYIDLPNWEEQLRYLNSTGKLPKAVSITMPYSFFTISTIVTFLMHTFTARRPMFDVGTYKGEAFQGAQKMQIVLQYNADRTKLVRELFHFLQDGQIYGVGILRNKWCDEIAPRTRRFLQPVVGPAGPTLQQQSIREMARVYSGNSAMAIDPFRFYPDPNVPMPKVNREGEYVFWRFVQNKHLLKRLEAQGLVSHVEFAGNFPEYSSPWTTDQDSARDAISYGYPHAGNSMANFPNDVQVRNTVQVDQGSVEIIPRELGLGPEDIPHKWLFSIGNRKQIMQAQPLNLDHGMHPVVVSEPYSLGYALGAPGGIDYLGPVQDLMSWLFNSHIDNVRRVLNDSIVVDPSRIEMQDLKKPGPGKIIRLKRSHMGQDIRTAITQLPIVDVTQGNVEDAQLLMALGEKISAVSENILGVQDSSGRKTATEVRVAQQAAASRLSNQARLISAQAITDLTEQWSLNLQQLLPVDFYLEIVGKDGLQNSIIQPNHLVGDYHYPIHDGTIPLDKIALFDLWLQMFPVVQSDPELRMNYDVPKMFEFIAELGGAQNIQSMRIQPGSPEAIQKQVQAGNMVPTSMVGQLPGAGNTGQVNPVQRDQRFNLS